MSENTTPANQPKNSQALLTPSQILELAKQTILHQDDALRALSVAMYYHLKTKERYIKACIEQFGQNYEKYDPPPNSTALPKPTIADTSQAPIFITGKTGGGKTHLVKELCRVLDVHCLTINATHLSNSGYKGMTLADVGEMLMAGVSNDDQKAMFAVVFFDEFDKLFLATDSQLGLYHRALATELLTVIEGTTHFPVRDNDGISSQYMLFILGGSFNLHGDKKSPMGFLDTTDPKDTPTTQTELTKMGLPDELAGRIGNMITMSPLSDAMMIDILKNSPTSPLVRLKSRLAMVDCTLEVDDEVLYGLMADKQEAMDKFGVRGLYQSFNEYDDILAILAHAPDNPNTHYTITKQGYHTQPILKTAKPPTFIYVDLDGGDDDFPF